jgi:hypothetical protein
MSRQTSWIEQQSTVKHALSNAHTGESLVGYIIKRDNFYNSQCVPRGFQGAPALITARTCHDTQSTM